MLYRFDEKLCLNGWWKFKPLYERIPTCDFVCPPTDGFEKEEYLVPSIFNRPGDAMKLPGESYYTNHRRHDPLIADENADVLLDTYGYPGRWSNAKAAWCVRTLQVSLKSGKRYFIIAEGAGPQATLFVNDKKIAVQYDPTLPFTAEVTDALKDGENTIAYLIEDYEYAGGEGMRMTRWPSGGITHEICGLWQDVYLTERDAVYVEDITIVTSVRKKTISLRFDMVNASEAAFAGKIAFSSDGWNHDEKNAISGEVAVQLAAGEKASFTAELSWENPRLWDPADPKLYMLTAFLVSEDGAQSALCHERFGFREIWIDNDRIMMNSFPLHLFADWGHRVTLHPFTRGWVKKWFGMMRDYNLNHSRLHTAPHPEFILEMADEAGIMITDEAAMHGSGNGQAAMLDEFWEHARNHVKNFVARDKNHPCLVLWSCENEMRWVSQGGDKCKQHLPEIRALINQLDPTRPAYHEGDSSLWNEAEQDIISRHYGKECSGLGWWDKSRPLTSGEIGLFHYMGPNNTLQLGGDSVWEDVSNIVRFAVDETALLVNDARANGVSTLCPWNFSCLVNLRQHPEKHFEYEDFTAPGIKPLFARKNTCEFNYWEDGKGYVQPPMTESIQFMFRPFAAIDLSMRTSYFANRPLVKKYTFVNDLPRDIENATANVSIVYEGGSFTQSAAISVKRGLRTEATFDLTHDYPAGPAQIRVEVMDGDTVLDAWARDISLDAFTTEKDLPHAYVLGDGSSEGLLNLLGCEFTRIEAIGDVPEGAVVVIERNTVRPASTLNHDIQDFCKTGGRVILLEQTFSAFPGIKMEQKPLLTAFSRDAFSPVLDRVPDLSLRYWGDDPYSLLSGNSYVVRNVYKKDACERMHIIADSGEGNFGSGDLESAAVFALEEGNGIVYACQFLLTEKYELVSAAGRIMANLLHAAKDYKKPDEVSVLISRGGENLDALLEQVKSGGILLASEATADAVAKISKAAGINLTTCIEPEGTYNCIKAGTFPELAGLSNADICGITRVNYCPEEAVNHIIAPHVMQFADGMEPLLVTAPKSCLRPFFQYGCSSEIMRTYTVTRYGFEDIEPTYVIMGRVRVGEGTVYVSTYVNPDPNGNVYSRMYNILLRNLSHAALGNSPLDGECAAFTAAAGTGKPMRLYTLSDKLDEVERMLTACGYQVERMNPKPLLDMYDFETIKCKGEPFTSPDGKAVIIYYTVTSPTARKLEKNDLGLPDPMAQTFLDMEIEGEAELFVNAVSCGTAKGNATFSDITIEGGFNHIFIIFRPEKAGSTLSMQWRNIMHEPEGSFRIG